ncbi:protein kintoun [Achroia grisella]|uniref:protein kintoun n=1 Tax=Achroia grisella TaxID=688607 RepID=UPI0027D2440D|nr:protein kintoun [Achroia grisella]
MATGVKPRDEESQLTRSDLEAIQDAMKNKKFRELLTEYCEEVRDPANRALYQKEMTQLEKERGYDVTFINPKGGYVIKTSVAGDRKAFINICSNENVDKPSCSVQEINGKKGMNWLLPYSLIPPREDYNSKKERCVIYDVVFHPDTLRMAEVNKRFRELVNKTAFDGLQNTYNIHLDSNNLRFPKSHYKGMMTPAVIRKEDPNYEPPVDHESDNLSPEVLEKLYPQHIYNEKNDKPVESSSQQQKRQGRKGKEEFTHSTENGYSIPKYVIKQQKNVDLQEFTYHKDSKKYFAIPSHIVIEVNLPMLSSTRDCTLDVKEKSLSLISEKPAKYKLNLTLPYLVNDECGNAKFDKSKRMLIVTLPVIKKNDNNYINSLKVDSGVESEENSCSQSDEDCIEGLVAELPSPVASPLVKNCDHPNARPMEDPFLVSSLKYTLPSYTHNVMDDIVAFTFHVKNTDPDSVKVKNDANKIFITFTSIGSGFVPIHYAAIIIFDDQIKFENVNGEAWDNNVILQLEVAGDLPQKFKIGLSEESFTSEYFDMSQVSRTSKPTFISETKQHQVEDTTPVVEVTNLGTETNIVVSSSNIDYNDDNLESPTIKDEDIMWTETENDSGAKSILRKPISMIRSYSESSMGDVASSMDYISSDCIPEESSLKKTVRFNDVIARQFYRYNSSIEGQKKKNQRRKSKKRNQDRRKSESEAEDDVTNTNMTSKPRLKSALKQRHDSGLADTSDAEADYKSTPMDSPSSPSIFNFSNGDKYNSNMYDDDSKNNTPDEKIKSVLNIDYKAKAPSEPTIWESSSESTKIPKRPEKSQLFNNVTCDNIKHNTDLYNPDNLNKGQYLEVAFKNDLIFDLDM